MDLKESQYFPLGRLNTDDSPFFINLGAKNSMDFVEASGVTFINLGGQNDWRIQNVDGNNLAFTLPLVGAQKSIYQITFGGTNGDNLQIDFLNLNGSSFHPALTSTAYTTTGVPATDTANWIAVIIGAFSSWVASTRATINATSPTPGTIIFSITNIVNALGFDYDILIDPANTVTSLEITQTQEAIDNTLAGPCLPIGSTDELGDLYVFSTSQTHAPISFEVVGAQASLQGYVQLNIAGNQLAYLTPPYGESVVVSGVGGTTEANGTWINSAASYNVISAGNTTITLFNCTYANAFTSGGTIELYAKGLLNISVNVANQLRTAWTSTVLLQTNEIPARFYNPIKKEINATINNNITSIYWTDGSDFMRLFEYTGPFIANGAIEVINPLGFYSYGGIDLATRNILNYVTPVVQPTAIIYSGGALNSGNWAYTGYFEDANLTPTGVGVISQPVNIYNGGPTDPSGILGTPGQVSSMQVQVTVSDIPENTFSYFTLIGINYVGDAEVAYIIKRVPIPANTATLTITHTGNEAVTEYANGFGLPDASYDSAQAQTMADNTVIYGNLTAAKISDFSAFCQTTTHTLNRYSNTSPPPAPAIPIQPLGDDVFGYTFGEWQNPIATATTVGYMLNETYRIWMLFELYDGTFTPLFWCDDIRFDLNSTNIANPFNQTARRTANNIPDYDLSQSPSALNPPSIASYVHGVTFSNPDLNYLIDGQPLNAIVKRIRFFVTENSTGGFNEVLACGLMVRHCVGVLDGNYGSLNFTGTGGGTYMFDNPFMAVAHDFQTPDSNLTPLNIGADNNSLSFVFTGVYPYSGYTYADTFYANGYYACNPTGAPLTWAHSFSLYSPDLIYNQTAFVREAGSDYIFSYGQPDWVLQTGEMDMTTVNTIPTPVTTTIWGTEIRLSGSTHVSTDYWSTMTPNPVSYLGEVGDFSSPISGLPHSLNYCGNFAAPGFYYIGAGTGYWGTPHHYVIYCDNVISQPNSANTANLGTYYGQYYRNKGSVTAASLYATSPANYPSNTKFGAIDTGSGIPTGAYFDVTPETNTFTVPVFGGDTFTQKSFVKLQYPADPNNAAEGGGVTSVFFCQNRMNFNMRNPDTLAYPSSPAIDGWINDWYQLVEIDNYDTGYTPRNIDDDLPAYDAALGYVSNFPTRMIYSLPRANDSLTNNNRIFLPANFYDLPNNLGPIYYMTTIQEELYTWQPYMVYKQFYNDRGTFQGSDASGSTDVTLGASDAFSKPPFGMTRFGSSNNFGCVKGIGLSGEDIVSWVDTTSKQMMIISRQGVKSISLEGKMRAFFENNMQWITGDNASINNGVYGIFDEKRKEFIWTFLGYNNTLSAYNSGTTYNKGQAVTYGYVPYTNNIPAVYTSISNSNTGYEPDTHPTYWMLQPTSNNQYYNVYTAVYSLLKESFLFYPPTPYMYLQWDETYLTPYPETNYNGIYLSDTGDPLSWYEFDDVSQQVSGYFAFVVNDMAGFVKRFVAMQVSSDLAPYRIDIYTQNLQTYILRADWRKLFSQSGVFQSNIFNDILTGNSSNPKGWNSKMIDQYCIIKITFTPEEEQKISNFVTKYVVMNRNPLS